jgi:hypothetical protein
VSARIAPSIRGVSVDDRELEAAELIEIRATIGLSDLPLGQVAWVDPTLGEIPYLLKKSYIVPTGRTATRDELGLDGDGSS